MEESVAAIIPVTLSPKNVYGLRVEVAGNIHFSFNQEVIYPVERVLVFHDFATNKQRFLRFPENTIPTVIALNTNRRLVAVAEVTRNSPTETFTNIAVYDTGSLKKRRNFQLPTTAADKTITALVFVQDSRAVVALTKHPNEMMYMIFFDKTGSHLEAMVGLPHSRATAICLAGNPQDVGLVAVCGEGIFKMMSKSETGFTTNNTGKAHFAVKCMAWLSMEALMLGLKKSKLALVENGELKLTFRAGEIDLIDVSKDPDAEGEEPPEVEEAAKVVPTIPVACMVSLSKTFLYSMGNDVYVFEKISKFKYQRLAIIKLVQGIYSEDLYTIKNMAVNPQQDTVIVTTNHSQIYVGYFKGVTVGEITTILRFKPLGEFIHIDEIVDISICSWRSIIMTASKDQTIRVWNYEKEKVELVKRYQVDITVTELYATGQFAAIGFSDQLRIMQIFLDDLNIIKTYNFPRCSKVKYSYFGHLMAAAYDNYVSITSVYNLDTLRTLKGHNGTVLSLAWSRDDKYLISGGAEGAIYQWEVDTGVRVQEIVQKGTEYRAIFCTSDPLTILSVTGSGLLRQMANSEMLREHSTPAKTPFLDLALARSDLILFVSTEAGHLYNVQMPFLDAGGGTFTNYRFFDSAVTKLVISHDDTLLIAASKKGTLAIFALQEIEGRTADLDQDLLKGQEVLIPRQVLKEKIEQISNLELRILQQAAEFQYQESQNEIFDSQQLADIHKGYCQALEALKNRNNELEQKHIEELNEITFRINDLKADQKSQMENLSGQFTERMLMEFQKFTSFSQSSNEIKDGYEEKLRQSAGYLQDTVEALEVDYKKQLEHRQELIRDLMQEIQDEKYEFNEYCRQVSVEFDANMMDTVIKYENIIKQEQDEEVMWRGKACVFKKKSETMSKEAERLTEEVDVLNEEHLKCQRMIAKLMREIDDLRKEVTDREFAISVKEKRIQEILHKNQELEKYKQVLSHRITELKMQIEPRECQINEKRKQIVEMEQQLDSLNKSNVLLEQQMKNLDAKFHQSVAELKEQRQMAKNSRETINNICTDIYHVAGTVNEPEQLREGIRHLFQKYASDETLKKHITQESLVQAEFDRQRGHIEKSITACKRKLQDSTHVEKSMNILRENISLLHEIEVLRKENTNIKNQLKSIEVMLKIPGKKSTQTKNRLMLTLEEIQKRRDEQKKMLTSMQKEIETLTEENQNLQQQIRELKNLAELNPI